jgi:aryl carrier-like protein
MSHVLYDRARPPGGSLTKSIDRDKRARDSGSRSRAAVSDVVARTCADVLGIARIDMTSNFFDLGGDSLAALRTIALLRSRLAGSVALVDLLAAPTLAAFAEGLLCGGVALRPIDASVPHGGATTFPLSIMQEEKLRRDSQIGRRRSSNIALVFDVAGPLAVDALRRALEAVTCNHDALRVALLRDGDANLQCVGPEPAVDFVVADFAGPMAEDDAAAFIFHRAYAPFDHGKAPLARTVVARYADSRAVVAVVADHVIADLYALGIVLQDVAAAYDAVVRNMPPSLPSATMQTGVFALTNRDRYSDERVEALSQFWRRRLGGEHPHGAVDLPVRYAPPEVRPAQCGVAQRSLDATAGERVRALTRRSATTPFALHVAAAQIAVAALTGERTVSIVATYAHREEPDAERLVAWLSDHIIVRSRVDPSSRFVDVLARTFEDVVEAIEFALPQKLLVRRLLGESPPFSTKPRILLSYFPLAFAPHLHLSDCKVTPRPVQLSAPSRGTMMLDVEDAANGGIMLTARYEEGRFPPSLPEDMLATIAAVLEHATSSPDGTLDQFLCKT